MAYVDELAGPGFLSGGWKPVPRGLALGTEVLTEVGWVPLSAFAPGGAYHDGLGDEVGWVSERGVAHVAEYPRWIVPGGVEYAGGVAPGVLPAGQGVSSGSGAGGNIHEVDGSVVELAARFGWHTGGVYAPQVGGLSTPSASTAKGKQALGGVGAPPAAFSTGTPVVPRVATVVTNPEGLKNAAGDVVAGYGEVVFIRPTRFTASDELKKLVQVTAKGVKLFASLYSDFWVHPKYGRTWRWFTGDDSVRYGTAGSSGRLGLLNKFSVDLYGGWVPPIGFFGEPALVDVVGEDGKVELVRSRLECDVEHPIRVLPRQSFHRVKPAKHFDYHGYNSSGRRVVADVERTTVPVFNFTVPGTHNVIARQGREDRNPRTKYPGGAVVVGDWSNKRLVSFAETRERVRAGMRPDWRTTSADKIWEGGE